MPIRDLRVDEAAWTEASAARRAEWRAAILDLLAEASFSEPFEDGYVLVSPRDGGVTFEVLDEDGVVRKSEGLSLAPLAEHVREYLQIIYRMDSEGPTRDVTHLEALDMAKKVAHDRAGHALEQALPGMARDLATHRKLFTLVLVLTVDTTAMTHARGHRRFRLR